MARTIRKKVAFTLVIVFLSLAVVEIGVRAILAARDHSRPVVPPTIGQFDKNLGWSLKPLAQATSNRTGLEVHYRINSKGLRDEETEYDKPGGVYRIVLVGDSYAFGFGVPIEKHFSSLLEGYFTDVEVINMGVDGYGLDQELLFLTSEGFRYNPDLVLAYGAHYADHRHMHTVRWGKAKPKFVLKNGKLVLENSPVVPLAEKTPYTTRDPGVLRRTYRLLDRHIVILQICSKAITRMFDSKHAPTSLSATNSEERQEERDEKNLQVTSFHQELHAVGEALVVEMHRECRKRNVEFVFVNMNAELNRRVLEKGVRTVFLGHALANPKYALPDNLSHINECGNGVVAWELFRYLVAHRLVPENHLND